MISPFDYIVTVFSITAIKFDGVQVFGYIAWSLVDGFEWNYGYTVRRGLFYIDFNEPNRTRTPKTSAQYYQHVVAGNGFLKDKTFREVKGRFPCDFHWGIADSTLQVRRQEGDFAEENAKLWLHSLVCPFCRCRSTSTLSHHSILTLICTAGT